MSKHQKTWSPSKKLEIINYYKQLGVVKTKREFGVSIASIYKWEKAYEELGMAGLEPKRSMNPSGESEELKALRRENDQLKKLVAEKELRLRIQQEMLKKSR